MAEVNEMHGYAADAAGLIRAATAGDGDGVAALLAQIDGDERDGVLAALVYMVRGLWSAGYRSGLRFGSEGVPADELEDLLESDELRELERAELGAYLGGLVEHSRQAG